MRNLDRQYFPHSSETASPKTYLLKNMGLSLKTYLKACMHDPIVQIDCKTYSEGYGIIKFLEKKYFAYNYPSGCLGGSSYAHSKQLKLKTQTNPLIRLNFTFSRTDKITT